MNARYSRGASPIATAAALSVAILVAVIGSFIGEHTASSQRAQSLAAREPAEQQDFVPTSDADGNGIPDWQDELVRAGVAPATTTIAGDNDPLASIGSAVMQSVASGYLSLKQYDQYTPERGEVLGETIASNLYAPTIFTPHTKTELIIDDTEGVERVLRYRADMREALFPMVDLGGEHEFTLFASFIATNDPSWLDKLAAVAARYREAEANMLTVHIPESAAAVHLRAVNALGEYTQTLERLVQFAHDPIAVMALLRTYNEDEREFLLAFDALAKFYVENVGN